MNIPLSTLRRGLTFSILKDGATNTSSVAKSLQGKIYTAGKVSSDTHLLDFTSEQVALTISVHARDPYIIEVITMTEEKEASASPLVLKVLADHSARTGLPIKYSIINKSGEKIFSTTDVLESIPFYKIERQKYLPSKTRNKKNPVIKICKGKEVQLLKKYALLGTMRNFPTYAGASGYGASVVGEDGSIYYGGQYSSFEKRTGLHAEMATTIVALMNGVKKIKALGLVSSKHTDLPCELCGCCRQFFSELIAKGKVSPDIAFYCFAKDNKTQKKYSMNELLPNGWSSKKW